MTEKREPTFRDKDNPPGRYDEPGWFDRGKQDLPKEVPTPRNEGERGL